jgi:bifunctional non-homologous end joining protein LigD
MPFFELRKRARERSVRHGWLVALCPESGGPPRREPRAKKGHPSRVDHALTEPTDVKLTNLSKVYFPRDGLTKGDLIAYYTAASKWLIPYLAHRPITLQRYPDGIDSPSFFEKNVPRGAPPWMPTVTLPSSGNRDAVTYVLCNDEPTLLWLANLGTITFHVWMSHEPSLDVPDYALFDLDPSDGCPLGTLARVALSIRDALDGIGLAPLVKTSGGRGLHLILPLKPVYRYDEVRAFTDIVARRMLDLLPGDVTLERSLAKRPAGAVYIDSVQVGRGKTIVPPFVVRARDGAPVSMPLAWAEVEAMEGASSRGGEKLARWTIREVPDLLKKKCDPWRDLLKRKASLEPALEKAARDWSTATPQRRG